jgi:Flp pilus assembly protein TadG
MLPPLIPRPRGRATTRSRERGVTMALVAVAMFSIVAMAGLAIDVGTLYQANAEAQRSADAAALAAARALSLMGITGDPANSSAYWQTACDAATTAAQAVASQDTVGGVAPSSVTVTYLASDGTSCGSTGGAFGVNPMVKVQVQQASLPTYFARIWGRTGSSVSATATAEAFNPSGSETYSGGTLVPVQPRCVKPWIVPNKDPGNVGSPFVSLADGSITSKGIRVNGAGGGDIGESFTLQADCSANNACNSAAPYTANPGSTTAPATLQYVPALVSGTPAAVMSCSGAAAYDQAVTGCDQTTAYQCGIAAASAATPNEANLAELNVPADTSGDVQCLVNESGGGSGDSISTAAYPYQITAGSGNPLGVTGNQITSSNSIVTLPIYDSTAPLPLGPNPPVTIIGFLQAFIQGVPAPGQMTVTVLNVAGCGNGNTTPVSATPRYGTSPVPIRLITPP